MANIQLNGGNTDLGGTAAGALFASLTDASGNPIAKQHGEAVPAAHDGLPTMVVNDGTARFARGDRMGNAGIAMHCPLLDVVIDGATVNASQLGTGSTTQTITQATSTGITLNANSTLSINTLATVFSMRKFAFMARGPMICRIRARLVKGGTNGVADWGFGDPPGGSPLTIGAGWQYTAAGALVPFLVYNGSTPITAAAVDTALIDSAKFYWWDVIVSDDSVQFVVQNPDTGLIIAERTLFIGADAAAMFAATSLGVYARTYVGAAAATGPATQLHVGRIYVGRYDVNIPAGPEQAFPGMGLSLDKNPLTGAQTTNSTNNTAATNAALSNTVPGYATLGGRFAFAAPAGVATDYALFAFQVPVGYQAHIRDITIEAQNTGTNVAGTPSVLEWDIGVNGTLASLAGAGVVRQGGVGSQSLPVGAVPGTFGQRIEKALGANMVCDGGRYIHAILRMPTGTATASQIITGSVRFGGFWSR